MEKRNRDVIGLDIAKTIFHAHVAASGGKTGESRRLRRKDLLDWAARCEPALIGMEACATSQHWARELTALGHDVKLMPARYVKPYIKRGKSDAIDAAGIAEAVTRMPRKPLVLGATTLVRYARITARPTCLPDGLRRWILGLLERRPARLVTIAIANKLARTAWAVLSTGEAFRGDHRPRAYVMA